MGNKSYSRLASSLSIDELLDQPESRPPQNWLLTYIDVFVLIVMLVVTLVALSKFEEGETPEQKTTLPQLVKNPSSKPVIQSKINSKNPPKKQIPVENTENQIPESLEKGIENKQVPDHETDIQEQLNKQLEDLGLKDSINMQVTQGYAKLEIQDNILYESSQAQLTDSGQSVLQQLTPLLEKSIGLIYIEGHTDNQPINTSQFPSNWELGSARATSVLHFLALQDIDPSRMRAVTYADTKPLADNETAEGRQKNRRVNIVIKVSDKDDW